MTTEIEPEMKSYIERLTEGCPKLITDGFMKLGFDGLDKSPKDHIFFKRYDPTLLDEIVHLLGLLRNAYFSIIGAYSVVLDIDLCIKMTRKYPWHGTSIRKGEHFDFVWKSFANNCYIFEERIKQLGLHLDRIGLHFKASKMPTGKWVKQVNAQLGEHIKFRGQHVHNWSRNHHSYEYFSSIDFLSDFDEKYAALRKIEYQFAKTNMLEEMKLAKSSILKILSELDPDPIQTIVEYCCKFEIILNDLEKSYSESRIR